MAKGIIGEPFTFTVLFVDPSGTRFNPDTVEIEVFYFDSAGTKQVLVTDGTTMPQIATETGRFAYTMVIPDTLEPSNEIYGIMTGEITSTGEKIVVEETVDPFEEGSGGELEIQDEGVSLGSFSIVNFVGAEVEVKDVGGVATVYIPPLPPPPPSSFQSHWNSSDGDNGNQSVSDGVSRTTTRISTPNGGEGNPFKTGGWAGSNRSTTRDTETIITTPSTTTGWGGDSYYIVNVFDADGTTVLETYTSPAITGNFSNTTGNITSSITNFAVDPGNGIDLDRNKAKLSVTVDLSSLLPNGGRYNCQVIMYTDTTTDGTGPYTFTQNAVFIDTDPESPEINGVLSFVENGGVTRHISGVNYYNIGSAFTVGVSGIDHLNSNTARTSGVLSITPSNIPLGSISSQPWNSPGWSGWTNDNNNTGAEYLNSSWEITQTSYRLKTESAKVSAFVRDPWTSSSTIETPIQKLLVDTFTDNSNETQEYFRDEVLRQDSTYNSANPSGNWVSSNTLVAGEAIVYGGQLQVPSAIPEPDLRTYNPQPNPNYSALNAPVSYFRTFVDNAPAGQQERSELTLSIQGTFVSNATDDLANEDLKIFVRRRGSTSSGANTGPSAPPLRLHGPLYDFNNFNDGATVIGSYIRRSQSSGGSIKATFGGALFNCVGGVYIEIQIVNPAIKISSCVFSFG